MAINSIQASSNNSIGRVVIVGGGTAGLICALALRIKLPDLKIKVIRSKEIGVIGVGEGTLNGFNHFFFRYLGLDRATFYAQAKPTWKLGIRFNWGKRPHFNYTFSSNCDWKWDDQQYANGYYTQSSFSDLCQNSSLMDVNKSFIKQANGDPLIKDDAAYHLQNSLFVDYLEQQVAQRGVALIDAKVEHVMSGEHGVEQLKLDNGETHAADLFVDASGFRSMLLGQILQEPFESFKPTLFCDRAMIGVWERTDEDILPYTTSDTMDAGWSWRIDHETHINRGYVYSSSFASADQAETEFRQKNPKISRVNTLSFQPGKYRHAWVKNVVGIGNASGFVEPLEASSIGLICGQSQMLVKSLQSSHMGPNQLIRNVYNQYCDQLWESVRGFLAIHYRFNTRSGSPFWKACNESVHLGEHATQMVDFFRAYGPNHELSHDILPRLEFFGVDGYLTLLLGLQVEYDQSKINISASDWQKWQRQCQYFADQAQTNALSVKESLERMRSPAWVWF